jgi:carbon monoxide dehydrogenase subunit G
VIGIVPLLLVGALVDSTSDCTTASPGEARVGAAGEAVGHDCVLVHAVAVAAVHEDFVVEAEPEQVWAALRDVGAAARLFPGVLTDSRATDDGRVVTFAGGAVVREVVVDLDDDRRRLAYTSVEGPLGAAHHHATMQVLPAEKGRSRVIWVTDVLPDALAQPVGALMRQGAEAMTAAMAARADPRG